MDGRLATEGLLSWRCAVRDIVSEEFCDDVVELCFYVLSAMDSTELAAFINTIVRLADREVLRAVRQARGTIINGTNSEN
jgi:hypothetical protein